MEYLIYAGVGLVVFFAIGYFLELGLNIILSVIILATSSLILSSDLGSSILENGFSAVLEEPLFAVSLIASVVALISVWLVSGMTQVIVMAVWAILQVPSAGSITENASRIADFLGISEEEVKENE